MAIEEINGIGDMIMTIEGFEDFGANFVSAPAKASSRFYSAPAKASSRFYSAPAEAKSYAPKFTSAPAEAKGYAPKFTQAPAYVGAGGVEGLKKWLFELMNLVKWHRDNGINLAEIDNLRNKFYSFFVEFRRQGYQYRKFLFEIALNNMRDFYIKVIGKNDRSYRIHFDKNFNEFLNHLNNIQKMLVSGKKSVANFKPVIAKIKENQKQIKKNQLTLRDEINQLNAKFRDLYNWVKQAEKTVSTPQEKKVLNEKMAELTNVAKVRANKLTRYKLYDKANIFLNYAIKNANEGKTEDVVQNIAGATIIGKYSEQFKNVENLAKKQDELDKAKRDIQIKEQEAMSLEKLAQETGEPEYMNEATDIKEEISEQKENIDTFENEVNVEEKKAESIFGGENEFSESGAENMTLEGIDDIDDFEGFWDTLGNIVKAPIKAVQWVGKKTFDGVGWVAKNVGGIAGKLLGGVFGGGAPMPMPMDTGMPQQESGIGKWLLIGGAGIVGLGAVYFLTKKD